MAIIQGSAKSSGAGGFYPTTINQSLRFEDGDSAYLNKTLGSGDSTEWTWSAWVKRGNLSGDALGVMFHAGLVSGTNVTSFRFLSTDKIRFYNQGAYFDTDAVFRDTSSWYHIVLAFDSDNATTTDRAKIYVNGVRQTGTWTGTSGSSYINTAVKHTLGYYDFAAWKLDGYMAEVHFTDGTAYTADAFGELKSGIWIPKSPSVTYGTNGFYLDFANSADIGNDVSGNNNDFTVNNLVASDVVLDSPTNNFATLNSVEFVNNSGYLSEGNLKISDTSSANLTASGGTIGMKSGKWYWEAYLSVQENGFNIGIVKDTESVTSGTWNYTKTNFYAINGIGTSYVSDGAGAQNAAGTTFAQGDTVQVAYDADTGKLYFGKNGTWLNSADPAAGTGNLETTSDPEYGYHPATSTIGDASGYSDVIMNFGQDSTFAGNLTAGGNTDANGIGDFKYGVPDGYLALCTSNLPDPVIDPAQDATPEDHFNVVTFTGDGTTDGSQVITVGFQPDLTWHKSRSGTQFHAIADSVRGGNLFLASNSTAADDASNNDGIVWNSTGYAVDQATDWGSLNNSGLSIVSWNWKAGGTASTVAVGAIDGTNPTIATDVSANTTSGFSIIGYLGNGTDGATIAHGLDSPPELCIFKTRDDAVSWIVGGYPYGPSVFSANNQLMNLDLTNALAAASSHAFTVGTSYITLDDQGGALGAGPDNIICYAFHSVDGFSKVGSYVGNGSADGPFVYTGFRPKWVMVKQTTTAENWIIIDAERNAYNLSGTRLIPNLSNAEANDNGLDLLSNGFKARSSNTATNESGQTHVYIAFAEQPFKYSNAR